MSDWSARLEEISALGRYLSNLDVIDIAFLSEHVLEVYVANNDQQRQQGLANLTNIDVAGMLFHFDHPTYIPFTMKDMLFDLEVAWYDDQGHMVHYEKCEAGRQSPVCSPHPFKYVLEVPSGTLPLSDLRLGG